MAAYGRVADFLRTPCGLAEINFYRFQDLLLPSEWAAVQKTGARKVSQLLGHRSCAGEHGAGSDQLHVRIAAGTWRTECVTFCKRVPGGGVSLCSDPILHVVQSVDDAAADAEAVRSGAEVSPVAQGGDRGADQVGGLGDREQRVVGHGVSRTARLGWCWGPLT